MNAGDEEQGSRKGDEQPKEGVGDMGMTEQAGNVATSVVDSLKNNPSCLAALAVVALYGVLQYFESENQNRRMMDRTREVGELLKTCLDNTKGSRVSHGPIAADWWIPEATKIEEGESPP